jgi:signal transduction histidine kinase
VAAACFEALASGSQDCGRPTEFRVQLPDGSLRWLQHRSFVIRDAAGRAIRAAGIVTDVTERAEALIEKQLARALSQRLVQVQENERRHVSRELHDQIGQTLTWLRIHLDVTAQLHGAEREQRLAEAQTLVQELMTHVNDLSLDLRPGILDDLGLREALLWLFERNARRTGLQVQFEHMSLDGRLARDVETTAFRVVQEALTNAVRHAQVGDVRVRAWVAEQTLNLQIEDHGVGFDAARTLDNHGCFGICSMRERVRLHGGELSVDAAPGQGCRITAQIPVGAASTDSEIPGGEG